MSNPLKIALKKYNEGSLLFKASIWFVVLSVFNHGAAIFTQPFVNRILSVDEVGIYNIYNTWHSLLSATATLNLFSGIYEVLLVKEKQDKKTVIPSILSLCIVLCFSVYLFIFVFLKPITSWWELDPIYIVIMAISVLSDAIIQFWNVEKRFEYSYKKYSIVVGTLTIFKCALTILFSFLFVYDRVFGRILGLTVPSMALASFVLLSYFRNAELRNLTFYWKRALRFNIPLLPHFLSSILLHSSDKIMIQKLSEGNGEYYAGLYSVAYSLASLTLVLFNALTKSYRPFALTAIKDKNYDSLKKKTNQLLLVSVIFSILIMVAAPEGLLILGGGDYMKVKNLIPILVIGVFLSSFYVIFSNVELIFEKSKYVFPITVIGASVNIILNFLLIPKYGYEVAAYTTVIGYLIIAISHYFVSRRIVKEQLFNMKIICLLCLVLVIAAIVTMITYGMSSIYRYIIFVALGVIFVLTYKKSKSKG